MKHEGDFRQFVINRIERNCAVMDCGDLSSAAGYLHRICTEHVLKALRDPAHTILHSMYMPSVLINVIKLR